MNESALTTALSKLDAVNDAMTVRRVFGEPYQLDGATVIPVAAVRGGGGGGGGEGTDPDEGATGSGSGMGFGVSARPIGAFVAKDGEVTWSPCVDVTRIVVSAQLVGLGTVLAITRVIGRRRRRR